MGLKSFIMLLHGVLQLLGKSFVIVNHGHKSLL
jgi:hypothetical protein